MTQPKRQKSVERYLWQRGNVWWFRQSVPKRYRPAAGIDRVQRSLQTSDRNEASIRAAKLRADLYRQWEGSKSPWPSVPAVSSSCPSELDFQLAATDIAFVRMEKKIAEILSDKTFQSQADYESQIAFFRRHRDAILRTMSNEPSSIWSKLADKKIAANGWIVPNPSEAYDRFVQMIAEAGVEVLNAQIARLEGNFGFVPSSPVVRAGLGARKTAAAKGQKILELFEIYGNQRIAEGRKRKDTVTQDRKVVASFAAFVGHDKAINSLSKEDVREWRNAIASCPPNYGKLKSYRSLPLREAAAKAVAEHARGMSATTVGKYLSTISPFLGWCVSEGYASRNPCDGLHFKLEKGRNRRPSFKDDQLERIFSSPLFVGFLEDGKEHIPGNKVARDWRYWIPLVCAFTGSRIGEIAQLRTRDIHRDGEVWLVEIKDDPASGQQTKSGKSRTAPLHKDLIALGFVEFVKDRSASDARSKNSPLFPELKPNERDQIGGKASRFWRDYLTRIGMKNGRDGYGAHSFRHTMTDKLRKAGYLDNQIGILLGHALQSTTAGYGSIPQGTISMLTEMIESISIPISFKK